MTLKERIADIKALTFNLKQENPEIKSITFDLYDCELEEIEELKLSPINYSNYHERAGTIVVSNFEVAIFAYSKKCVPVTEIPVTPKFEFV